MSDPQRSQATAAAADEAHASLNLTTGPLCSAVLFDDGAQSRLLLVIHHLVVDLVSWPILIEDLYEACLHISKGHDVQLPPRTNSFKHWAEQLQSQVSAGDFQKELPYWLSAKRQQIPALPIDSGEGNRPATEATARIVSGELGAEDTLALLHEMPHSSDVQVQEVLLTAVAQTFLGWTKATALLLDLEGLGREGVGEEVDLSRTVGWFTTLYPVLLEITDPEKPMDALHAVKSQLRRIPNHGIGYGALRYLSNGDVGQHLRSLPEAEVNFLYQGQRRRRTSSTATFDLVAGPIGTLHSPRTPLKYLFNLNAWIEDDRLHMDWIYSELLFRHDTVERLSQEFIHRLKSLIDASRNTRQAGWASVGSQFGWDQSDVENIAAAIAKAVGSS